MSNTEFLINFTDGQKIKAAETNSNNKYILNQVDKKAEALEAYIKVEMESFKDVMTSGSMKTGDCKIAFYDTVPEKFLVANGASLLITDYKALYDVIGTQYGQEDETHFNLPDLRNRVPEGFKDADEAFGSFQGGSIPNLKGNFRLPGTEQFATPTVSGAFAYEGHTGGASGRGHDNGPNPEISFNASRSSNLYKDGVTRITVDRVKVNFLIKYED